MTIYDFIKNREKVSGKALAIQKLAESLQAFLDSAESTGITPYGTEIVSDESVISTKVKPLTLKDKLMELEQLSNRVMNQKILAATLADINGDDDPDIEESDFNDSEEDLSFGSDNYVDENGDKRISLVADDGEGDGGESALSKKQADGEPSPEPSDGE